MSPGHNLFRDPVMTALINLTRSQRSRWVIYLWYISPRVTALCDPFTLLYDPRSEPWAGT
jgi:hypothetical protein